MVGRGDRVAVGLDGDRYPQAGDAGGLAEDGGGQGLCVGGVTALPGALQRGEFRGLRVRVVVLVQLGVRVLDRQPFTLVRCLQVPAGEVPVLFDEPGDVEADHDRLCAVREEV